MKTLKQNIISIYGKDGERWLEGLPRVVDELGVYWGLKDLRPVENMTFHYVAKAVLDSGQAVVLKLGCDEKSVRAEKRALEYFEGEGAIRLLEYHEGYQALLLEQAVPGITLHSLYPSQEEVVMDAYVAMMKKLHAPKTKTEAPPIADWLSALDKAKQVPVEILARALELRDELLSSMGPPVFLHGDLHQDNVLQQGEEWVAIDPKGVMGEPEFEIAAFDFMVVAELASQEKVKELFEKRVELLAQKVGLDKQRIQDWVFVRLVLMAAWMIEDKGDPGPAIRLAEKLIIS